MQPSAVIQKGCAKALQCRAVLSAPTCGNILKRIYVFERLQPNAQADGTPHQPSKINGTADMAVPSGRIVGCEQSTKESVK
jgi:hypothetical protein